MSPTDGVSRAAWRLALILPAAGGGTRMGGPVRKPLIELLGLPIVCHTLKRFQQVQGLRQAVVVVHPDDLQHVRAKYWTRLKQHGATHLVAGGERRQDSVAQGLAALEPDIEIVLVHDAVRPLVPRDAVEEAIRAAVEGGAAIVAMPVADTVKRVRDGCAVETVSRRDLWVAQTPQVFRVDLLRRAFEAATRDRFECTDDAQLVERIGVAVKLVRGSYANFKITTPEHLRMAEALLARETG